MCDDIGLLKRLAASLYELLSLLAIWLLCTAVFLGLFGSIDATLKRFCLQLFLWLIAGAYFVICWVRTGQTLAAQAWKIRLVDSEGATLGASQSVLRYALASISLLVFGFGYLWALVDREHLFLHDRILKTRLIKAT